MLYKWAKVSLAHGPCASLPPISQLPTLSVYTRATRFSIAAVHEMYGTVEIH
ncbi:predicted protein [Botrytis cinerea T4]|uniref:Uncharacterized protein n=1 Tax=Botryotinia fuckeliana (strain T4) TaxID=999810 RepID=G2YFN1_BOTF4|nr:predicted protein [Botrytis cinerea T4]